MYSFFFFNDTATTEIYTLSLHGALPILPIRQGEAVEAQHLLGAGDAMDAFAPALQRIDIAREHPGPRRRVGPVTGPAEHAAQRAHGRYFLRGKRLAKSSAISFMVTNFTPGWPIM